MMFLIKTSLSWCTEIFYVDFITGQNLAILADFPLHNLPDVNQNAYRSRAFSGMLTVLSVVLGGVEIFTHMLV